MKEFKFDKDLQIPTHIFRGYDIRGIAETELTDDNVKSIISAYATILLRKRIFDCCVGADCRLSSPRIKSITIQTLVNQGFTVYDLDLTLSQISYFAQYFYRSKGLVMITASHNPKEYNGFKLGAGFSDTLVSTEVLELKKILENNTFLTLNKKGKVIECHNEIKKAYEEDVLKRVGPIRPFKVLVDSCAATTGLFLPQILRSAGCEVVELNTIPDGNFPVGTPDPTESQVMERLSHNVKINNCDLGFSYDCDGDRVGIVDQDGRIIWNDTLVSIFAKDILDFLPGSKIIYNVLCSKQVEDVIKKNGGVSLMWLTGHSFIKAKVKEERSPFGGELSGHFFFMDNFYGHDDGAIASLRLLTYLTRVNKSLKEIVDELPKYFSSPEIKVGCPDAIKFQLVQEKLKQEIEKLYPQAKYTCIDGVRMDTTNEMIVIRASHNGPYLTIKFEARDQEKFENIKRQILDLIQIYSQINTSTGTNIEFLETSR